MFWVNVPVCVAAIVAGPALVPTSRDADESPLDPPGALLSIVGLSGLVYAIIEGPSRGWTSAEVVGVLRRIAWVLALFAVVELHRRHPMLDLRLFRNPRFTAASLAVTALYFCLFGTIFFQTQHLQFVLGYDPLGAGLRSVPFAVVLLVVANTTPRLVRWVGHPGRDHHRPRRGGRRHGRARRLHRAQRLPGRPRHPVRVRPRHGADHRPGHRLDHGRGAARPGRRRARRSTTPPARWAGRSAWP